MSKRTPPATELARWLEDEGRLQVWLARKLKVDQSLVSRWAAGLRIPKPPWPKRIEKATLGAVQASSWPVVEEDEVEEDDMDEPESAAR